MYVSERDIEVINDMMGLVQNAIEGGAEDDEYWNKLSRGAYHLFEKAMKTHYREKVNRKYKR